MRITVIAISLIAFISACDRNVSAVNRVAEPTTAMSSQDDTKVDIPIHELRLNGSDYDEFVESYTNIKEALSELGYHHAYLFEESIKALSGVYIVGDEIRLTDSTTEACSAVLEEREKKFSRAGAFYSSAQRRVEKLECTVENALVDLHELTAKDVIIRAKPIVNKRVDRERVAFDVTVSDLEAKLKSANSKLNSERKLLENISLLNGEITKVSYSDLSSYGRRETRVHFTAKLRNNSSQSIRQLSVSTQGNEFSLYAPSDIQSSHLYGFGKKEEEKHWSRSPGVNEFRVETLPPGRSMKVKGWYSYRDEKPISYNDERKGGEISFSVIGVNGNRLSLMERKISKIEDELNNHKSLLEGVEKTIERRVDVYSFWETEVVSSST